MRKHAALPALVVSIAFAAQTAGSSVPPTSAGAGRTSEFAAQPQRFKADPAADSTTDSPKGHGFEVNDERGLLLICIAPQIDKDPDTDIFHSCALAPGRTLDDVMHTFIQAIHYVQKEQANERAQWYKDHQEELVQKPAEK